MDGWTFTLIHTAAERLAAQGFLSAGTSILTALVSDFPHCLDGVNETIRWAFEFLWEAGGHRPEGLPWEVPSPEKFDEMEVEYDRGKYPSTPEENMHALELIDTKISLGDLPTYPCSLRSAAMMCFASGDLERARKYVDLEFKRIVFSNHMNEWLRLIKCRKLAPIILEGGLGRAMGQTAEGAKKDAETIIAAFRSLPSREERLRRAREVVPPTPLSISALLDILGPFKADDDESLRKHPTTEKEISDAGVRLGVSLPEDYHDFLLVSNGMNFMPPLELPGLRPVEELVWEEASDLGLDELEMSLGMKMKEGESKSLPKMGRLLMISAAEDEEQVWLLEPSQVENTLEVLKTERGLKQFSQPVGWRVVLWRHWCPEPIWYRSFRKYLEAAATTAKKVS
ncbi:hypothetical protein B0H11DRAFT_1878944 [Mycena galericulata]|nr:hypothetical protein B0H11DRAFT_1878944 [Mycena galericulata]